MGENMEEKIEVYRNARKFLRSWDTGVLSSIHKIETDEYPFGSICPFVTTHEGEIIILISDIAIHTKNIRGNSHVCFKVFDMESSNKQASSRISLMGDASLVENTDQKFKSVSERYFRFFPEAKEFSKAHNFYFYSVRPKKVHYIQTFGKIYTLDVKIWSLPTPEWVNEEVASIEHMNGDHSGNLKDYLAAFKKKEGKDLSIVAIDPEGFHMKVDGKIHYFNFPGTALEKGSLRREFVELAKLSKES